MTDHQAPLSDDELLSAFLDGELTGEDLARAERLLAEQPGSRQLLAELKALGDGLRGLPCGQLGDEFPQRVLRKAERQLLSGSQGADRVERVPARWRNKRPWIYAAAALAAGLVVAVVSLPQRTAKQPAAAGEADRADIDQFASQSPHVELQRPLAASTPATRDGGYPQTAAAAPGSARAAKPPTAAKRVGAVAGSENQTVLKAALAQWGLAPQDADEIVRQAKAGEADAPATTARSLTVWSCTVNPDAPEQDRFDRVLARHDVRVLEQRPLAGATTRAADAAKTGPPASETPVMAVLVAGSRNQLDAALADFRARSDTFRQLTDLGRKSLPASAGDDQAARAGTSKDRKRAPGAHAAQGGASGGEAGSQALKDESKAARERSFGAVERSSELVLIILRRAEPVIPASPKASGEAAKPAPATGAPGEE